MNWIEEVPKKVVDEIVNLIDRKIKKEREAIERYVEEITRGLIGQQRVQDLIRDAVRKHWKDEHLVVPAPDDGVYVKPGDVVRYKLASDPWELVEVHCQGGDQCAIIVKRCSPHTGDVYSWHASLEYLTTRDGKPVKGVRE